MSDEEEKSAKVIDFAAKKAEINPPTLREQLVDLIEKVRNSNAVVAEKVQALGDTSVPLMEKFQQLKKERDEVMKSNSLKDALNEFRTILAASTNDDLRLNICVENCVDGPFSFNRIEAHVCFRRSYRQDDEFAREHHVEFYLGDRLYAIPYKRITSVFLSGLKT